MPQPKKSAPKSSSRKKSTAAAPAESDVKAEKTMRNLRSENQQLFRAILESSGDGLLVMDYTGKIIHYNQQFVRIWRIPNEVLRSGSDSKLLHNVLHQLNDSEAILHKVRHL